MAGRPLKERSEEQCICRRMSNFDLSCWQNTHLVWTKILTLRQQISVLRRTAPKRLSFIVDHAMGLPVLRTLCLSTCRRQYPGAATGRTLRSSRPAISAFPDMAVGSACTSTFSRCYGAGGGILHPSTLMGTDGRHAHAEVERTA